MITVNMKDTGPGMDQVEELVADDESVEGIWCVPQYSNPTGVIYTDEVVERLAALKTKAKDFRIFWNDPYAVHHLDDKPARLKNILATCKQAGNPERVFIFGSSVSIRWKEVPPPWFKWLMRPVSN